MLNNDDFVLIFQANETQRYLWDGRFPIGFQHWGRPHKFSFNFSKLVGLSLMSEMGGLYTRNLLSYLQPRQDEGLECVALRIYSSLQLEWFTVNCKHKFRNTAVICQEYFRQLHGNQTHIDRQYMECPIQWVQIGFQCHRMVSLYSSEITCNEAIRRCRGTFSLSSNNDYPQKLKRNHLFYFYQWLDRPREESFYAGANGNDPTRCLTLKIRQNPALVLHLLNNSDNLKTTTATCATDLVLQSDACLYSQFPCRDRSCILAHYACDGTDDCLDGSDEKGCDKVCNFHQLVRNRTEIDCYRNCFPTNCTCTGLYYQCWKSGGCIPASTLCDDNSDCVYGEDEMECYARETTRGRTPTTPDMFTCDSGVRLSQTRVNDLVPDCPGGRGEDEPRLQIHWSVFRVGSEETHSTRSRSCPSNFTQCIKGLSDVCYPRHKICVYEVESDTLYIKFCRNGAHLDNCSNHECPSMYKCSHSYCVPYHYVCNGRTDCPHGEDEDHCSELKCPGLLRCRYDGVCVHPNNIRDNITDCLLSNDDEKLLSVKSCPESCKCLGNAVTCSKFDLDLVKSLSFSLKKIRIERQIDSKLCLRFPQLLILDLSRNNISFQVIPQFCSLPVLTWLCLAQNDIHTLTIDTWRGLPKLMSLELQMNPIHTIEPFSFSHLNNLRTLNLSHTNLTRIGQTLFYGLDNLVTLDLSHNPIVELHGKGLVGMKASLVSLHIVITNVDIQYQVLDIISSLSLLKDVNVYSATCCLYMSANITCHFTVPFEGRCCKLIANFATELLYGSLELVWCCSTL